ncbi:MAG TPA: phosphatase PAP2 family protein [Bacteroidia bacterium]|nr:phosphatase PAP2 family protein [Bacteroidia bacterium]
MLEQLNQWDTQLFLLINKEGGNAFFDVVMPQLREKWVWAPLYLLLLIYFYRTYKLKNTLFILLFTGIIVFAADTLLAETAKNTFKRPRPCHEVTLADKAVERVGCGGQYGFFSAHAANHFALALFFSLLLKKRFRWATFALVFWAALVSYAQIYVGKHYPGDILAGAFFGSLLGYGMGKLLLAKVKGFEQ